MEILITGADGVLGSNVVRELLNRNYNVTALIESGKDPVTLHSLNIETIEGNILNPTDLDQAIQGKDAVIHCAASTNVWPSRSTITCEVNVEGTRNVVNACLEHNIKRLIYVGTANSFGYGDLKNPGKEGNPYVSDKYGLDYMDSKFMAQQCVLSAVKSKGLPAVVVNPTFMIGPFDAKPSSGAMIIALAQGKVPGYTQGGKNYINVKDAAVGIVNAITMGRIGECYILGNENLSFKEAFRKIANVVGCKAPTRKISPLFVKAYGKLNSTLAKVFGFYPSVTYEMSRISCDGHYYSAQKAIKELKLPQTPLEKGIKDCFEWFKANGYLKK
ncbi:MAG: NAD-dependent epimerase/dehydratase family protein [Flavobacteriales bacterium]|nr:NAD-dependent epimerase/dehydratase family protein [Flavobacteriales bacterium]